MVNQVTLSSIAVSTKRKKIGKYLLKLDQVSSTNAFLLDHAQLLATEGVVVTTDLQTGGRGRMQREWHGGGEKASHLFTSIVFHPEKGNYIPSLTLLTGIAVYRTLDSLGIQKLSIKWPNDLLIDGKKICGILCEMRVQGDFMVVVIGVGINIQGDLAQYPPELREIVTTLEMVSGIRFERDVLLESFLNQLDQILAEQQAGLMEKLVREWEESSSSIGRKVCFQWEGRKQEGNIIGLNPRGNLKVQIQNKEELVLNSGEVTYVE